MANPLDYSPHSQTQSGENLHTQESGDAGLSSNMEHKFYYKYEEGVLPVADTGSCVRPIPKGEINISHLPVMAKNIPHPPESQPASTVEGFLSKSTFTQTGLDNNLPPQLVYIGLEYNGKEAEVAEALPGTATITEALEEDVGGNGSIMDGTVDTRKKTGRAAPVEEVTNSNSYRKRAGGKKWKVYRLCVVAVLLINFPACKGSDVGPKCFVCKDKEKCLNLRVIYSQNDQILYERKPGEGFSGCSEMPPPMPKTPETCTVCHAKTEILISCSDDVGKIQPEADGSSIQNISNTCEQQKTSDPAPNGGTSHYNPGLGLTGLMCSAVLFLIVVGALMIS